MNHNNHQGLRHPCEASGTIMTENIYYLIWVMRLLLAFVHCKYQHLLGFFRGFWLHCGGIKHFWTSVLSFPPQSLKASGLTTPFLCLVKKLYFCIHCIYFHCICCITLGMTDSSLQLNAQQVPGGRVLHRGSLTPSCRTIRTLPPSPLTPLGTTPAYDFLG